MHLHRRRNYSGRRLWPIGTGVSGGGASAFNPALLTNIKPSIQVALSRSQGKLWQNAGKTVPAVADADPVMVATCPFTGVDWSAGSNSQRPLLYDELGDGRYWSLSFDGTDDAMGATLDCGSNCTLYFRVYSDLALPHSLFDSHPGTGDTIRQGFDGDVGRWSWLPTIAFALGLSASSYHTIGFLHSLGASKNVDYRRDGSATSSNPDADTTPAGWSGTNIGSINNGGNGNFTGRLAGTIFTADTESVSVARQIEAYLTALTP